MQKLNWIDPASNNRPSHDYAKGAGILIFQLYMFWQIQSYTFCRYTHIEKGLKEKGGHYRFRPSHSTNREGPGPFSKVNTLKIAFCIMHENSCSCHLSVIMVSIRWVKFWIPRWHSLSQYTPFNFRCTIFFFPHPQKPLFPFPKIRKLQNHLFYSLKKKFKCLNLLFLLENYLLKEIFECE